MPANANAAASEAEQKHTQGPWTSERVHQHDACVYVDDPQGNEIAVVYARRFDEPRDIEKAKIDARLLAAAPDLYKAILYSDDAHWTPAMRAAMAKAEGR